MCNIFYDIMCKYYFLSALAVAILLVLMGSLIRHWLERPLNQGDLEDMEDY